MIDFFDTLWRLANTIVREPVLFVILLIFFLVGYFLGKFTVRIGWIKLIILLIFGLPVFMYFKAMGPIVFGVFLAGVLANHTGTFIRILSWAGSLADVFYAVRYKRAFEDVRRAEREAEEAIRRRREEAYRAHHTSSESDGGADWRDEARKSRGSHEKTSSSGARKQNRKQQQHRSNGGSKERQYRGKAQPPSDERRRHLKIMGLDPNGTYSKNELRKAYRQQAKKVHPDVGGSNAEFQKLKNAYEWLGKRKLKR